MPWWLRTSGRAGLAALLLGLVVACAGPASPRPRLVDLSHPFGADTLYWPTDEQGFSLQVLSHGQTPAGYFYAANRFATAEHGGTHVDAPIHFFAGGQSVDEIPLERLVAPGVMIDVLARTQGAADYQIRVADLEAWEARNGRIPEAAIVLLHTGWDRRWPDRERYLGTARRGPEAVAELHFPGLAPEAARWLAEERRIAAVGIDTASIDHGQSRFFLSHQRLFAHQIPAFENLANLGELPPTGFQVVALPMKIAGGSGAPLRAIAILP